MPFLYNNYANLYFETEGEGLAVVFVHAGIASSAMWDDQWQAFAQHYQVVRYDTRGFGRTVAEDVEYSNRDDLRAVMNHLHIESAALIGCSRGGQIALDTALESPERAWAYVSVCGGIGGFEPEGVPAEQLARFEEMDMLFDAREWPALVELETLTWVDGFGRPAGSALGSVRDRINLMNLENVSHVDEGGRVITLDPPSIDRLEALKIPALICIGVYDTSGAQQAADVLTSRISGAQKLVFEGSAHVPSMEEPEKFNEAVLAFLKANSG